MTDWFWRMLGKRAEAAVVYFASGDPARVRTMYQEVRDLEPAREHFVVCLDKPIAGLPCWVLNSRRDMYRQLKHRLEDRRIGLALFLLGPSPHPLRRLAVRAAPRKLLAFNLRGERHHLQLGTCIASWLFLRGVELDRIWLRPRWWPAARERSVESVERAVLEGRALREGKPRVAIVSPYFPWPLSHGGAVRIHALLREAAKDFDVFLYCMSEEGAETNTGPVLDYVHRATLFTMPRYREPAWASLSPPQVGEFTSAALRSRLARDVKEFGFSLIQAEYTQMAQYGRHVLVEHDVTFDLYRQIHEREQTWSSWWNLYRWRRYEFAATGRARRTVVMSDKDAGLLPEARTVVIPNGVDLARFQPRPEPVGSNILFIGSFRHFPNVTAYRFFATQVWPLVREAIPDATWTVVAGPDPEIYWRAATNAPIPASGDGIEILGYVSDVERLYAACNVVVAPTLVSAGTNLKVLEAMAMERAVAATPSGCAGLGLEHKVSAWIAEDPAKLAEGVIRLLREPDLRRSLAQQARLAAERSFDWTRIGEAQRDLWRELGA